MRYWLVNKSDIPSERIHKLIGLCKPIMDFNIFVTDDHSYYLKLCRMNDCTQFKCFISLGGFKKFTNRIFKYRRPMIVCYFSKETKYPIVTGKTKIYRKKILYKNANEYFVQTIAHEIKHLENWVSPIYRINKICKRFDRFWTQKLAHRVYKKAEWNSQEYQLKFYKKYKELI